MDAHDLPNLPRGTPRHGEIPILFLGQIAVDIKMQGLGVGRFLMQNLFNRACVIAIEVGCYAVLLDVMADDDANAFAKRKDWYEYFGFQSFVSNQSRMFMTIADIRKAVEVQHSAT